MDSSRHSFLDFLHFVFFLICYQCMIWDFFAFLSEKKIAYDVTMLCMCPPFQLLNQLTDIHEIWYEHMPLKATIMLCFLISYSE